jgi:hypothetical protein
MWILEGFRERSGNSVGGDEAHAGAVAFAFAGGLAGVFEGGVVDGAVAAGAEFAAALLQLFEREATGSNVACFFFQGLCGHGSSLRSLLNSPSSCDSVGEFSSILWR